MAALNLKTAVGPNIGAKYHEIIILIQYVIAEFSNYGAVPFG